MASSVHIVDGKGGPLISRSYRGDVQLDVPKTFTQHVLDEIEDSKIFPVFESDGHTFVWIRHNNIYMICVSRINCLPALLTSFMQKAIQVFEGYFKNVNEESVRDNFCMIYELLDEMADFGYPQYTEETVLKEFITQEGIFTPLKEVLNTKLVVATLPSAVTKTGSKRVAGIKYSKNEVFLDVIESVNLLVSQEGDPISSEIVGQLKLKAQLSGEPSIKIGLNDKVSKSGGGEGKDSVDLQDLKFHDCVQLDKYESERQIVFNPPDGEFELMNYRLPQRVRPLIHIDVQVQRYGNSRVEMLLKARSTYKKNSNAKDVQIRVPLPTDAESVTSKANSGKTNYRPEDDCLLWEMTEFPGGREFMCKLEYKMPTVRAADSKDRLPIAVKFEIPYFAISGFQVRYLKVTEKSGYAAQPWVRYVTKSGDYQIRTK